MSGCSRSATCREVTVAEPTASTARAATTNIVPAATVVAATDSRPVTDDTQAASGSGYRGSIFVTGQQSSRAQRHGRCTPESIEHPGKMLPAIARYLIRTYTNVGDPVGDPMAGIGTTVVEAMHLGRHGIGVEYEPRWAALGADNIRLATAQGAAGTGVVYTGDSRHLPALIPAELHGRIALVITSPPYGPSTHGRAVTPGRGQGKVHKIYHRYGTDTTNLAYRDHDELATGFGQILAGCVAILRPGGVVAVTARPYRHEGELVDIPGMVAAAGIHAGLRLVEECPALIAGIRDGRVVQRASMFQRKNIHDANEAGDPQWLQQHEELIIFRASSTVRQPSEGARPGVIGAGHRLDVLDPNHMDRRPRPARGNATDPDPDQGRKCGRTPDSCPPNPLTAPGPAPSPAPDRQQPAHDATPWPQGDSSITKGRR
jgi:hypothetical protein